MEGSTGWISFAYITGMGGSNLEPPSGGGGGGRGLLAYNTAMEDSDSESADDIVVDGDSEGDGNNPLLEFDPSEMPTHLFGRFIDRGEPSPTVNDETRERAPQNNLRVEIEPATKPSTAGPSAAASIDSPLSPWRNSKSKGRIINELKDDTSNIHLLIGPHTSDFGNVNFQQIKSQYADNRYQLSNFKSNVKRIINHHMNKTGPFKPEGVEKWYTSVNNVSRGYLLLFSLYMDTHKYQIIKNMPEEDIWKSHSEFQLYEFEKFKTYNQNMATLTSKRKHLIDQEEESFKRDMSKLQERSNVTCRGYPFWHTHPASILLKDHVTDEMLGKVEKMKPHQLWNLTVEYQDFPLSIFRKHLYQERSKQLAAPYWQHKRNKNAQKKHEEREEMLKEWNNMQMNRKVDSLIEDWGRLGFDEDNEV